MSSTAPKRGTLNICIKPEEREFIDRAAVARGKSRTDLIGGVARQAADLAAEQSLLDRTSFADGPEAHVCF